MPSLTGIYSPDLWTLRPTYNNLSPDLTECLAKTLDAEASLLLDEIYSCELTDPCSGRSTDEIVEQIATLACEGYVIPDGGGSVDGPAGGWQLDGMEDYDPMSRDDLLDIFAEADFDYDLSSRVDELLESDITDPCDPDKTAEDIVSEILDNMGEDCSLEGFEAAMAENFLNCVDQLMDETITPCEEALIRQYPRAAYTIYRNSITAKAETERRFPNSVGWLDCADAFRHAYFNAINSHDIGKETALLFSDAHECGGSNNDALMDLHNNSIGHDIGQQYDFAALADRVCDQLRLGKLKVLDGTLNPNADLIPSNQAGCDC